MNAKAQSKISVVGICGSLRAGSYTRMALRVALEGAQEVGAQTTKLIDLGDYGLIFCDGKEDESGYPSPCENTTLILLAIEISVPWRSVLPGR